MSAACQGCGRKSGVSPCSCFNVCALCRPKIEGETNSYAQAVTLVRIAAAVAALRMAA